MELKKRDYTALVPSQARKDIESLGVKPSKKRQYEQILGFISHCMEGDKTSYNGYTYLRINTIADYVGYSHGTVYSCLEELSCNGIIERRRGTRTPDNKSVKRLANEYRIPSFGQRPSTSPNRKEEESTMHYMVNNVGAKSQSWEENLTPIFYKEGYINNIYYQYTDYTPRAREGSFSTSMEDYHNTQVDPKVVNDYKEYIRDLKKEMAQDKNTIVKLKEAYEDVKERYEILLKDAIALAKKKGRGLSKYDEWDEYEEKKMMLKGLPTFEEIVDSDPYASFGDIEIDETNAPTEEEFEASFQKFLTSVSTTEDLDWTNDRLWVYLRSINIVFKGSTLLDIKDLMNHYSNRFLKVYNKRSEELEGLTRKEYLERTDSVRRQWNKEHGIIDNDSES